MDSDGRRGLVATIKGALGWYWRRVKVSTNECDRCGRTISTGNPNRPHCSEACAEAAWQDEQW